MTLLFDCSRSPVARTVELDEDEFDDSLTAAKASRSVPDSRGSFGMTSALLRVIDCVTGGLAGLFVFGLDAGSRIGAARPGDTEDMEVGVVSRLYEPGPGDSEYRVEGLPLKALCWLLVVENKGVGGGRSVVVIG